MISFYKLVMMNESLEIIYCSQGQEKHTHQLYFSIKSRIKLIIQNYLQSGLDNVWKLFHLNYVSQQENNKIKKISN